jgi:hypothetical protein
MGVCFDTYSQVPTSSISTLGADYPEILPIPYRKIIAQHLPKSDVMSTLQGEFLPIQCPAKDFFQCLGSLILPFLFLIHSASLQKEKPVGVRSSGLG